MFNIINPDEIKRFLSFIKPHTLPYSTGLLGRCVIGTAMMIIPVFVVKDMLDAAVNGNLALLLRAGLIVAVMAAIVCLIYPLFYYLHSSSVKMMMARIRLRAFRHTEELPMAYFNQIHSGDIISRLTNDVQAMEQAFTENFHIVISSLLYGIASVVSMLVFDWRIAIILIIFGIISSYINSRFAAPIRRISDTIQEKNGLLIEKLMDLLSGCLVMKMFHIEKRIAAKFIQANDELTAAVISRSNRYALMESANFLLLWINFGGIMAVGAVMVLMGSVTLGKIVGIVQLLNGITFMFLQFGSLVSQLQNSLAGASRVFALLDLSKEEQYPLTMPNPEYQTAIEMQDVVFQYEPGKQVLNGISIKVKKGQVAALVSSSGGGKSTILKLLLGFYPVISGKITINGRDLGQYTLPQLRELTAYVSQDAYLFDGSIEENIGYGNPNAGIEEIICAARAAKAHDFIMKQPDGYRTLAGERGVRLSGGEKQRIAIARALLKNAPILLLDEATSALDSESEQLVQEALNVLMEGRTVILISHRLSTITHADVIYVLKDGKVSEQGKHDALLTGGELYSRLYQLQFVYAGE